MAVEIYNQQHALQIPTHWLESWTHAANLALPLACQNAANDGGILTNHSDVEITIVNDATIAQVHLDFMDIAGATDVITFSYENMGEIIISADTVSKNATEYAQPFSTELMLYIIHGLLHLAGHEDLQPTERETMEKTQWQILKEVWTPE